MPFDIDARIAEWRKSLLDTTKRNRLIKFVAGRIGGIQFVSPNIGDLWTGLVQESSSFTFPWKSDLLGIPQPAVDSDRPRDDTPLQSDTAIIHPEVFTRELTERALRSPNLRPNHILTDFTDNLLASRLTRLARTAQESATDHGVTTLFVAFGFLRWYERDDSTDELLSPLLLVPVQLARATIESEYTLRTDEDDVLPNHCLAELLQAQFRIKCPNSTDHPLDPEIPNYLSSYLAAMRNKIKHVARWEIVESTALGVFHFQKLAMWEDLGRNAERLRVNAICRAVAGDSEATVAAPRGLPAAADLDRVVSPETMVHILDADSSQHEAIEAVKNGAHLVMDGPPGTGKSQTIANIIAESLSAGKTVLFVSEKTAALEVVKRRLDKCGLGDFCLELHSHRASKKEVVSELGRCLDLPPSGAPDISAQLRQLAQDRQKLNDFVAELHAIRHPYGWSAFRAHGELARLDRGSARSRISIKDISEKDADYVRQGSEILAGLADCASVIEEQGGHPWRGCKILVFAHTALDDAEYQVGRLSDVAGPAEKAVLKLEELGFAAAPFTVGAWRAGEDAARRVLAAPLFPMEWFKKDARTTAKALVALDEAAQKVRGYVGKLPEFEADSLRTISAPAAVEYLIPDRERVDDAATLTVRARVAALKRIETGLRNLSSITTELHGASRNVAGLLQVTRTPTATHLGQLADVAMQIAEGPPIPLEWWDTNRRFEILDAFAHAAEEERTVFSERAALLERFVPEALAPESLMFVLEAASQSRSFWLRLWPRWWKIKRRLLGWYLEPSPSGSTIRADLLELEKYHRRAVAVRQIAAEYSVDLITGTGDKPDWAASSERVHSIDWLEQVGVQHTFKAMAGPRRTLNRTALVDAASALSRLSTALKNGWNELRAEFAVPDAATQLARGASELASWLLEEANAVRREADALAVLVAALTQNKDVLPAVLRERATTLRDLVSARRLVTEAASQLDDARTPEDLETADHSRNAELGRQLLESIEALSRPITPAVAAAFSNAAVREKLTAALRQSESARRPFDKAWECVTTDLFDPDSEVSTKIVLNKATMGEIKAWATARATDAGRLVEWTRFAKVEHDAVAFGVSAVLDEVKTGEISAAGAADAFRARFFRLWLDTVHQQVPTLAAFATDAHERLIARFGELDRLAIRTTSDRVRNRLLTNSSRPIARDGAPEASELGILLREVNKKRRHLPLRRLFARIPSILPRIKPCLMMSPLAVSTYLDTPEVSFDLVIFDEASQVRPHDAVCAIYRGRQLVVGGDPRQLPPTDFFTRTSEETSDLEEDDRGTTAFESLLDVCLSIGLTRKRLKWHYRSRSESLIAFSNRYFYDGRLVTFPSAAEATGSAIDFVKVAEGRFKDGVNPIEARQVAELVLEHARSTPNRSLGVIAFSQRQQDLILDELDLVRRKSPATEGFFGDDRDDPFFVKNLENVQGDERDVILLSVGYGPDELGKVAMRFGPLNRAGGERRLNVAVTRARQSMTVVSSISAADVDLSRTAAEGAKLLRVFLEYAERGPVVLSEPADSGVKAAEPPFERAVGDELVRRGLTIERQVGCGGYIIDIAITDPQRGGRYLLGVECDGATYHNAATARDRDRLRQAVLEGLGWRLIRVWSTDWVRDREKHVNRILAALECAKNPRMSSVVHESEPARVLVVRRKSSKALEFESIETVPEEAISQAVLGSLSEFGSMPIEDLIAVVSKRLGFKRTGPKIRERVTDAVNVLVAAETIAVGEGDRVRLVGSHKAR